MYDQWMDLGTGAFAEGVNMEGFITASVQVELWNSFT